MFYIGPLLGTVAEQCCPQKLCRKAFSLLDSLSFPPWQLPVLCFRPPAKAVMLLQTTHSCATEALIFHWLIAPTREQELSNHTEL